MKKLIKILALSVLSFNAFAIPVYNYDEINTHTHSVTAKFRWMLAPGQEVKNDADGNYLLPHAHNGLIGWTQAMVCLKSIPVTEDKNAGITAPMLPTDKIAAQISIINLDLNADGSKAPWYGEYYWNTEIDSINKCADFTFLNQMHLHHNLKLLVKARNLSTTTSAPAMVTMTILGQ